MELTIQKIRVQLVSRKNNATVGTSTRTLNLLIDLPFVSLKLIEKKWKLGSQVK